ncbi:MAG: DUF547 domain-containing protein [Bacteroidota bacterium]
MRIIYRSSIALFFVALAFLNTSCKVQKYKSDANPISHAIWDSLLQKHVSEAGWVDYEGFIADSTQLNRYLDLLSAHHPNETNWTADERLAYWINAYNAFTVKLIVDHYPVVSIKDIKRGIPFVNSVWDIKFIQIEGATYDLNNIEHGIIRQRFEEPRIHFAVNCASVSCPKLANFAFTATELDTQLTRVAKGFLADPSKNKFVSPQKAELSKIFSWYGGDFKKEGDLIDYVNQYAPQQLNADADIDYLDYNWNLNDSKTN